MARREGSFTDAIHRRLSRACTAGGADESLITRDITRVTREITRVARDITRVAREMTRVAREMTRVARRVMRVAREMTRVVVAGFEIGPMVASARSVGTLASCPTHPRPHRRDPASARLRREARRDGPRP